ncbi:MAG TPA: tyrosine-type recombinase/integrase [Blastocatellia bacterium]|jgi:site-specific recombinase XerD
MDSLLASRLLQKLSFLGLASQDQLISYLTLLVARNYANSTLHAVVGMIKRLLLHLPPERRLIVTDNLSLTTSSDIDCFVNSASAEGLSPSTINTSLSALKAFFDFLLEDGRMQLQPIIRRRHRLFAPATLPKPMAEQDLISFFKVIDSLRDRLIFLLMLRCGLRVSEVCRLTWQAVDLQAATVRVNNGKGQVDRIAYISPDLEKSLAVWQERSGQSQYLFPSRKVRLAPLGRGDVHWQMKKYLRLAGITKRYSAHCLRHTFAAQLLNAGVSLEVLKELMGHRSVQMTLRYTHLYESTKRQQYDQAMENIERRQVNLGS